MRAITCYDKFESAQFLAYFGYFLGGVTCFRTWLVLLRSQNIICGNHISVANAC